MDNQTVQAADQRDPLADDSYNRNPAYNQRRVALCDEDTVTMYFPKRVVLQRDTNPAPAPGEGGYVTFERGVNEVPVSLADHQWLRDNGARKYTRTAAESKQLSDQKAADDIRASIANIRSVSDKLAKGEGTLGKLINDDSLYNGAVSTVKKVDRTLDNLNDSGPISAVGIAVDALF